MGSTLEVVQPLTPYATCPEYPKIDTLFIRDEKFKVTQVLKDPATEIIGRWLVTEKVDGTNLRIVFTPADDRPDCGDCGMGLPCPHTWGHVDIFTRTDAGQIPKFLRAKLEELFPVEKFYTAFPDNPFKRIVLYIQKGGGNYRPDDTNFRVFDVLVTSKTGKSWWLNWTDVQDVALRLGVSTVPVLGVLGIDTIVSEVRGGIKSIVAGQDSGTAFQSEGIVARTDPYLLNQHGQRIVFKLKTKDF